MGVFRRGNLWLPHSAKRRAHSVSNLFYPRLAISPCPRVVLKFFCSPLTLTLSRRGGGNFRLWGFLVGRPYCYFFEMTFSGGDKPRPYILNNLPTFRKARSDCPESSFP